MFTERAIKPIRIVSENGLFDDESDIYEIKVDREQYVAARRPKSVWLFYYLEQAHRAGKEKP